MIRQRVEQLRKLMRQRGLAAYVITGTDPHQSEYVCERWRTRSWISGFTGSAGTVVVTQDSAGLWTDSRYFLQAGLQLDKQVYSLFKIGMPEVPSWQEYLISILNRSQNIGICAAEITLAGYRELSAQLAGADLNLETTDDLLDEIWKDRPGLPAEEITPVDSSLTGLGWQEKVDELKEFMHARNADSMLITMLDQIAWVLNLRGTDVPYNPVFLSNLLITDTGVHLLCSRDDLQIDGLTIHDYDQSANRIKGLLSGSRGLYITPSTVNMEIIEAVQSSVKLIEGPDIIADKKSVKHDTELEGFVHAHIADGIALVRFFSWLEGNAGIPLDEVSLAERLREFRSEQPDFISESFSTIAGFRDHGAIVHYSADSESAYPIEGNGLLILDSGGQYRGGTTDITRTLIFGEPTEQQRRDYTMVLKAHLALSRQQFPAGTYGYQLDGITRMQLWNEGLNYGHGTGHGVGHMLNVHEGPQSISPKPIAVELKPGMVISNEPGLYREGEYGIRIENLVAVEYRQKTDYGDFYGFKQLTLFPYERRLIDISLLDEHEIAQIDAYHQKVRELLGPNLDHEEVLWLKEKTRVLEDS
jgi:Xaa-Pro aminopeptidase